MCWVMVIERFSPKEEERDRRAVTSQELCPPRGLASRNRIQDGPRHLQSALVSRPLCLPDDTPHDQRPKSKRAGYNLCPHIYTLDISVKGRSSVRVSATPHCMIVVILPSSTERSGRRCRSFC
eukprot:scaffold3165_cov29-Tisochrysis_lutea.AAC.1